MSERIERLRGLLEEPLLITNPVNVLYLTGLTQRAERENNERPASP